MELGGYNGGETVTAHRVRTPAAHHHCITASLQSHLLSRTFKRWMMWLMPRPSFCCRCCMANLSTAAAAYDDSRILVVGGV
jgi:hypothetical protein